MACLCASDGNANHNDGVCSSCRDAVKIMQQPEHPHHDEEETYDTSVPINGGDTHDGSWRVRECSNSDEIGFVLLEDCDVSIVNSSSGSLLETGAWMEVDATAAAGTKESSIGIKNLEPDTTTTTTTTDTTEKETDECNNHSSICTRCNLLLFHHHHDSCGARLANHPPARLVLHDSTHRFDGTIRDTLHKDDLKCSSCCSGGRRSDAALLVGLVRSCQDTGFVQLRHFRIMVHRQGGNGDSTRQRRASLLMTLAIPQLNVERMTIISGAAAAATAAASPTKVLPPCTQLLLTLVRSDWEHLYPQMKRLQSHKVIEKEERDERATMFPSNLSLEELYLRLQGAASQHGGIQSAASYQLQQSEKTTTTTTTPCLLMNMLPLDVLVSHVASYLKARSLDALRCTCKYLHYSALRAIVPGLSNLKLYQHQIESLDWMRRREVRQVSEKEMDGGRSDLHRAASGGATTRLAFRPGSKFYSNNSNIRVDTQYGRVVTQLLMDNSTRQVARGGLLCDDPGLGKTITVLSLILQTFGLGTESQEEEDEQETRCKNGDADNVIFRAYWKAEVPPYFRRQALNKLLLTLARENAADAGFFSFPVDPIKDDCPDYFNVIQRPMSFADIQKRAGQDGYGGDFDRFCYDVELCFRNAMTYNPPTHIVYQAAMRLRKQFKILVTSFKAGNVKSAKKSFSSTAAKPNSLVASILEKRSKQKLIDSLLPSSATLLVVPSVLLSHWEEQLRLYLDTSYCTKKVPIIFHFSGDNGRGRNAQNEEDVVHRVRMGTHFPLVFIDQASAKPLPTAGFLAMFQVVITTNRRLSTEWKNGSFADELKSMDGDHEFRTILRKPNDACPLLKVHWLRLIVDEGHAMGRGTHNNAIRFASWIEAQRRWAMTGTPTPQTVSQNGLSNLLGLVKFLQHDFFSARLEGDKVWQNGIARSWKEGNLAAFFRLRSLLLLLMVRHTKRDIEELSPPRFHRTYSVMSQEEITAYNTLVCAIQSNLITTAMEGKTSGRQDSLLHRRQAKHARKAFSNVRLACSGGTRVVPTLTQKNWDETVELLTSHGVDPFQRRLVENFMHRAVTEQLSGCQCCGLQLSTLMVLPCGDLICTECMDSKTRSCPVCHKGFDVDEFQLLQPGIEYTWKWNLEEEKEKESKGRMRSGEDRVERTRGIQAGHDVEIGVVERNVGAGPMRFAPIHQTRTRRKGDGHNCEYEPSAIDGKCKLCLEEHDECVLLSRHSKCNVCFRIPEPCPEEESKFFYVTHKLEQLVSSQQNTVRRFSSTASRLIGETVKAKDTRPVKVILFSQFRPILDLVGHRLLRRFGAGCVAEYWGYARKQELHKFCKSRDCFCMLLGKDGAEGLDLSFVTHIIFLDQVWDKSLFDQVVARAFRMGAQGHVEVETLISKHSVEQTMVEIEEKLRFGKATELDGVADPASGSAKEHQSTKFLVLLKNLSLIKSNNFVRSHVETNGKRKRKAAAVTWQMGNAKESISNGVNDILVDNRTKKVRFVDEATADVVSQLQL